MVRTLLLYLVFMPLFTAIAFGQDSFDTKKQQHRSSTSKTVQPKPFNLQPLKKAVRTAPFSNRPQNFQMPSSFDLRTLGARFEHSSIRKNAGSRSVFIKSKLKEDAKAKMSRLSDTEIAATYLSEIGPLLNIKDAAEEFRLTSEITDVLGQRHLKMQQMYQGLKVYGGELIVHMANKTNEIAVNGIPLKTPETTKVAPAITVNAAISIVEADLDVKLSRSTAPKQGIIGVPEMLEELIFYPSGTETVLARHLTVFPTIKDRWEYFIDATTGAILNNYYHTCSLVHDLETHTIHEKSVLAPPTVGSGQDLNGVSRQINTFNTGGSNYLIDVTKPMYNAAQSQMPDNPVGGIMTLDLRNERITENTTIYHVTNSTNTWNNRTAVSAHYNANVAYEYFRNTFNRNSINGQGGTIISLINVVDTDGGGLDNAYWNGTYMFYGNGRDAFKPIAGALDVGGHEMSHGVIQNTANLEYQYQSGAMNESFADIFGAMIDRDDWQLGEDVVRTQFYPSGALRDMSNPNNGGNQLGDNGWQPKDMTEYYTGNQDNGGVHVNSGIPNRAYYLFATSVGKSKAEQIFYRTLTTYLTASSQFIDLRLGVIQAATDLHGANSPEVQAAQNAFDTVGITDGAPTDTDDDIPVANGSEFILSVDVSPNDDTSLYISDTNGQNYVPLTTTLLARKPSVADDGSFAIYVTEDNTINAISLDQNNIEEFVISDQPLWAAVALSKDGSKLAAVRNDVDGVIFVSDINTSEAMVFELYNPTTAEGISTGEVLYADALEWDYSGQYLIYDALNELNNANGSSIDYWDVGSLRAWNNQTNSFGDGTIQKIFTNLPEGLSIGNPSFSKTSGNILAFDVFDDNEGSYEVITANIETGTVVTVYRNNKLGFPNFSKNDDKLIFDTQNGSDEDIAVINLAADKLTPQGTPSVLIPNGIWGIWYTVGERATASSAKEITDFRFNVTNPASVGVIAGNTINVAIPNNINPQGLVATFSSSAKSTVYIGNTVQQSGINSNNFTGPVTYTVVAEDGSTKTFTVTIGGGTTFDPNDEDSDGVPNANDLCPNTPIGSVVDFSGCPKFSLPTTNFRILAQGESCIASNNGSITVNAQQNLNYTAILSGNGVNRTQSFSAAHTFNDLEAGNYALCFTVQGQSGYQLCYDVVVEQPESLSVTGKLDRSAKSVTLKMSGGAQYFITLNNESFTTTEQEIQLKLTADVNAISVTTDQDCQGKYNGEFLLNDGMTVYPNPVVDRNLNIYLPASTPSDVLLKIGTLDGQTVFSDNSKVEGGRVTIDTGPIATGMYVVYITTGTTTMTQKIIIK